MAAVQDCTTRQRQFAEQEAMKVIDAINQSFDRDPHLVVDVEAKVDWATLEGVGNEVVDGKAKVLVTLYVPVVDAF